MRRTSDSMILKYMQEHSEPFRDGAICFMSQRELAEGTEYTLSTINKAIRLLTGANKVEMLGDRGPYFILAESK